MSACRACAYRAWSSWVPSLGYLDLAYSSLGSTSRLDSCIRERTRFLRTRPTLASDEPPPRLWLSSDDLYESIPFLTEADYGAARSAVAEERDGGVSFTGLGPPDESRIVKALRGLGRTPPKSRAQSRISAPRGFLLTDWSCTSGPAPADLH